MPGEPVTTSAQQETERRALRRLIWRERLLGLASTFLRDPIGASSPQAWNKGAPVILYHKITDGPQGPDPIALDARAFERQVDWLRERYTLVTAGELARRLRAGEPTAGHAAITFDDGYDNTFERAWPILRARGAPATLFIDTARLGGARPALTRDEVRAMAAEGMEIGSHSVSHVELTTLDEQAIQREVASWGSPIPSAATIPGSCA
jgi:hypothetical protein